MSTAPPTVRGLCVATKYTTTADLVDKFHRFCDDTSIFIATQNTRPVGTESPVAILLEDKTPALRGWCKVLEAWTDATGPYKRPGVRLELSRLTSASQRVFDELRAARAESGRVERRPRTEKYPMAKQQQPPTLQIPTVIAASPQPETMRIAVLREAFTAELPIFTNPRPPGARPPGELDPPTDRLSEDEIAVIRSATSSAPVVVERAARTAKGTATLPPARAEPGEPPPPARAEGTHEARAPHSPYILPANPFSELTDESLGGFIDCRLYEDTTIAHDEGPARPSLPDDEPAPLPPPPAPPPPPIGVPFGAPFAPHPTLLAAPPQLLNLPSFRPGPTTELEPLSSRARVRWDLVIAAGMISFALVFAVATLVRVKSAPGPRSDAAAVQR